MTYLFLVLFILQPPALQFKGDVFYPFCLPLICNILFLDQENKYKEEEWLVGFHFNFCLALYKTKPPTGLGICVDTSSPLL